jgi:NitT/TauT family transport system ATP-binding protein
MIAPMTHAVEVEEVTVAYDGVPAIADVNLRVDSGEFVTVVGPSGSGKTTLLRAVGGLEPVDSGRVRVAGEPPGAAQAAGNVGFVFQAGALLPWKTALGNVMFLRRLAGKPPARDRARDRLAELGLTGREDARPRELSGGMRQRVAVARAVHLGADVLLLDEPFGELDELTRADAGAAVRKAWRDHDRTVLFVTHDVAEAVFLGDRCVVVAGDPGRVTGTFDVDLPRPRDETVRESRAFQEQVTAIRRALRA